MMRVSKLLFLAWLPALARGMCYLTGDDCPVCFVTDSETKVVSAQLCPDGIDLAWVDTPAEPMTSGIMYEGSALLTIDTSKFTLIDQKVGGDDDTPPKLYQLPHCNVHSCISKNGICTPHVSNTPGLSTHSPSSSYNLTLAKSGDGFVTAIPTDGLTQTVIPAEIKLTEEQYNVIMHVRFFLLKDGKATKYDVAMGISRTVIAAEEEAPSTSLDAIISVGAIVLVMTLGCVYLQYKVYTGSFSWDTVLKAMSNEYMGNVLRIITNFSDVFTFTLAFFLTIWDDDNLVNVLPLAVCALVSSWVITTYSIYTYLRNMYEVSLADTEEGAAVMQSKLSRRLSVKKRTKELQHNHTKEALVRTLNNKKVDLFGIVLESMPLNAVLLWTTMITDETKAVGVIALSLAMVGLGIKVMSVRTYAVVQVELALLEENLAMTKHIKELEEGSDVTPTAGLIPAPGGKHDALHLPLPSGAEPSGSGQGQLELA